MTPSEREAFDALVKYAEFEHDAQSISMDEEDFFNKYFSTYIECFQTETDISLRLYDRLSEELRRFALEKAREVQGAQPKVKSTLRAGDSFNVEGSSEDYMKLFDILVNPGKNREEVREGETK